MSVKIALLTVNLKIFFRSCRAGYFQICYKRADHWYDEYLYKKKFLREKDLIKKLKENKKAMNAKIDLKLIDLISRTLGSSCSRSILDFISYIEERLYIEDSEGNKLNDYLLDKYVSFLKYIVDIAKTSGVSYSVGVSNAKTGCYVPSHTISLNSKDKEYKVKLSNSFRNSIELRRVVTKSGAYAVKDRKDRVMSSKELIDNFIPSSFDFDFNDICKNAINHNGGEEAFRTKLSLITNKDLRHAKEELRDSLSYGSGQLNNKIGKKRGSVLLTYKQEEAAISNIFHSYWSHLMNRFGQTISPNGLSVEGGNSSVTLKNIINKADSKGDLSVSFVFFEILNKYRELEHELISEALRHNENMKMTVIPMFDGIIEEDDGFSNKNTMMEISRRSNSSIEELRRVAGIPIHTSSERNRSTATSRFSISLVDMAEGRINRIRDRYIGLRIGDLASSEISFLRETFSNIVITDQGTIQELVFSGTDRQESREDTNVRYEISRSELRSGNYDRVPGRYIGTRYRDLEHREQTLLTTHFSINTNRDGVIESLTIPTANLIEREISFTSINTSSSSQTGSTFNWPITRSDSSRLTND